MAVKIEYGADFEEFDTLVGQTVNAAVSAARQLLSVPSDVNANLNGREITDDAVILKAGDVISFYKPTGSKGFF